MRIALSLALMLLATAADARGPAKAAGSIWQAVATPADRARLRGWRETWANAVARVETAGYRAEIARGGGLFTPDVALPDPAPPPGDYRCRTFKLGSQTEGLLDYVAYPWFACRIEAGRDGVLRLVRRDGSQRPAGILYPDSARRMVFLGTMALGDERRWIDYGHDAERDLAGFVERIGPARWRLALPAPYWESLLDIHELVPAH